MQDFFGVQPMRINLFAPIEKRNEITLQIAILARIINHLLQ